MSVKPFHLRCRKCNQPVPWPPAAPRCPRPSCRGPLQPRRNIVFDPSLIEYLETGMWRYRHLLPPLPDEPITLGEGGTPLLRISGYPFNLYFKNESLNPTGSFKDRGAALLINTAPQGKVVVDDSSGNAGAALAAYAARAGTTARIYVPAAAPAAKLRQIERYGAELVRVPGNRDDVTAALEAAVAEDDLFYASHTWHPGYGLALQTIAWEIWEQLGRQAPNWVIMPTGNGSLLRGIRWGFRALQKGNFIAKLPRLVAVQAAACAPLLTYQKGEYIPQKFVGGPTVADGVAIANPPLLEAMMNAVQKTKGAVIAIPEEDILSATERLARDGFCVEPTAALGYAALPYLQPRIKSHHSVVVLLTGHGFKSH